MWISPNRYRVALDTDYRGIDRSHSPASVDVVFPKILADLGEPGAFDADSVEVIAYDVSGEPRVFDASREGYEKNLLPHRVDPYYGSDRVTLNFTLPDDKIAAVYAYFDTVESGAGKPKRYAGLVGDGDFFHIGYTRREIGASHMDCFCDFDGDGDLDLFKCSNEPYVYCYENVGANRYVYRGRLASDGKVFTFPHGGNFRSWPTITFDDWDGDGDMDLFASFGDGPDIGHVVRYENVTEPGGPLKFEYRGRILTAAGEPVGDTWFASITCVDWDGDGRKDLIIGHSLPPQETKRRIGRLDFYRNIGESQDMSDIRLADPVRVELPDSVEFTAPRPEFVDMDGDGDLDMLLATQGGALHYFENIGIRTEPRFAEPTALPSCSGGHDGVKVADFDGDGELEYVMTGLWHGKARLFKNVGTSEQPNWEERDAYTGCPYTECVQTCDLGRQNTVRAVDWNNDGKLDLVACGEGGTVFLFLNTTNNLRPVFEGPVRILTDQGPGVRCCICDWNNDGRKDIVVTDWHGKVMLYLNQGADAEPAFGPGIEVLADGKPFSAGDWASILVCDWDGDGKKDIIFGQSSGRKSLAHWPHLHEDPAQDQGFLFYRNIGTDAEPAFGLPEWVQVGDEGPESFSYLRPNAGSFVDWDGDGKKDFIVCEFENAIHLYRNVGENKPGELPKLGSGKTIIRAATDQCISGVDVVDWNGDGRLDIVTGQGHGGSGLRYYTRDYIEDELNNTRPIVSIGKPERR